MIFPVVIPLTVSRISGPAAMIVLIILHLFLLNPHQHLKKQLLCYVYYNYTNSINQYSKSK